MPGLPVDPPETGGDCSYRRLHCQNGAEAGLALHNALVRLWSIGQRVRLDDRFHFSLRHEIKGLVEIFRAVLLAANDTNALRDEAHQRNRKRLRVCAHGNKPAVRSQSLNAVHHGLGRIGGTENHVCAPRCGEAFSVADNFIGAEIADQLVFIGGVRNGDGLEACSFRVLHCQVPKAADAEHGHALVRLGIGPAEPAIDGVTAQKIGAACS